MEAGPGGSQASLRRLRTLVCFCPGGGPVMVGTARKSAPLPTLQFYSSGTRFRVHSADEAPTIGDARPSDLSVLIGGRGWLIDCCQLRWLAPMRSPSG